MPAPSPQQSDSRRLPDSLPPLGLTLHQAAHLVGIGATSFLALVEQGAMPPPRAIGRRRLWSRYEVAEAFHALPAAGGEPAAPPPGPALNPWD